MAKKPAKKGTDQNAKSRGATGQPGRKSRGATGEQVQGVVLTAEPSDADAVIQLADQNMQFVLATFMGLGILPEATDKNGLMAAINWLEDVATPGTFVDQAPGELSGGGLAHVIRRLRIMATGPLPAHPVAPHAAEAPNMTGKASPHDKQAQQAAGEATDAKECPTNWYTPSEWQAALMDQIPGTDRQLGQFSLKAVAELLAVHCNHALAKGWQMNQGHRASQYIDRLEGQIDHLRRALKPFATAWEDKVAGRNSLDHTDPQHFQRAAAQMSATSTLECVAKQEQMIMNVPREKRLEDSLATIAAILTTGEWPKGGYILGTEAGDTISTALRKMIQAKAKQPDPNDPSLQLCNCASLEQCPLGTMGAEHRCTVDELQNLCNMQAAALRDCEQLIEKGFSVRIGDAWPVLTPVMQNCRSAIAKCQAICKRQPASVDRLSTLTEALRTIEQINRMLTTAKISLISIDDMAAIPNLISQVLEDNRHLTARNKLLAAHMPDPHAQTLLDEQADELRTSWRNLEMFASQKGWKADEAPGIIAWVMEQCDAAATMRKALAVFHDIGKRIRPLLREDPNGLQGMDLRLCDGSKYLFGLRMLQFDQAIVAYENTIPGVANIPEDIAAKIQATAQNISKRIHDAGCWAEKFVADVLSEELARLYRSSMPEGQTHHIDTIVQVRQILRMNGYGGGTVIDHARSIMQRLDKATDTNTILGTQLQDVNKILGGFPDTAADAQARKVMEQLGQTLAAVTDLQKAIGIMGQPEAMDRATTLRQIAEAAAKSMGCQPHEVYASTFTQWLQRICDNAATVTEARKWLKEMQLTLAIDGSSDMVAVVRDLKANADDKDRQRTADLTSYHRAMETAVKFGMNLDEHHALADWIMGIAHQAQRASLFHVRFSRSAWDNHRLRKALDRAHGYINTHAGTLPVGLHRNIAANLLRTIADAIASQRRPSDDQPFQAGDRISHFQFNGSCLVVECTIPEKSPGLWFVRWQSEDQPGLSGMYRADECTLQPPKSVITKDLQPGPGKDS